MALPIEDRADDTDAAAPLTTDAADAAIDDIELGTETLGSDGVGMLIPKRLRAIATSSLT